MQLIILILFSENLKSTAMHTRPPKHPQQSNQSQQEGHVMAVDVWLSIHRINDVESVQKKFEERQLSIEELLELSEQDLRSLCKELEFDTLTKTRIVNGVKNTLKESAVAAPAASPAPAPSNISNVSPSDDEHEDVAEVLQVQGVQAAQPQPQRFIVSSQQHEGWSSTPCCVRWCGLLIRVRCLNILYHIHLLHSF